MSIIKAFKLVFCERVTEVMLVLVFKVAHIKFDIPFLVPKQVFGKLIFKERMINKGGLKRGEKTRTGGQKVQVLIQGVGTLWHGGW